MSDDPSAIAPDQAKVSAAEQRMAVRERYGALATSGASCCSVSSASSCCGDVGGEGEEFESLTQRLGYSTDDANDVAQGANLGLGCGNPTAITEIEAGDIVLDLGSGAGFDCFLAAQEVGPTGRVIGVDMTPEMVERARENIEKNAASNVEFRLGEIEQLPVADDSVDVIISNCVINLSPDKPRVFEEAYRVLRPGGRLAISDVVKIAEFPSWIPTDLTSVAACVAGATTVPELEAMLADVGFTEIDVAPDERSREFIRDWHDQRDLSRYIASATIQGQKPTGEK